MTYSTGAIYTYAYGGNKMITIPELDEASTLLDADMVMLTHNDDNSEKVSGINLKESVLTVISGLTAGTALDDTDVIYVKKSNADLRKLTGAQIKAEVLGSISGLTAGSALANTDIIYVKKSDDTLEKLTGSQLKELILGSISDLTAASDLGDTDIVYIKDSSNVLKKLTGSGLKGSISITAKLASSVTITGPVLSNGTQLEILFSSDIAGVDANTGLQINYNNTNYDVKVGKDGSLVAFKAYEVSSGVFKYLQAYTTLDLIFDGTQFVIVGNPVVISTSDFLVYSNGFFKNIKYSTSEMFTGKYWNDGKPIYRNVIEFAFSSNSQVTKNLGDVSLGLVDFTHSYLYGSFGTRQPWRMVDIYITNGILYFTTSHASGNAKIMYEYTKTTD